MVVVPWVFDALIIPVAAFLFRPVEPFTGPGADSLGIPVPPGRGRTGTNREDLGWTIIEAAIFR